MIYLNKAARDGSVVIQPIDKESVPICRYHFLKNDILVVDNTSSMSPIPRKRKVADWKKKKLR